MKTSAFILFSTASLLFACTSRKPMTKGFQVSPVAEDNRAENATDGLHKDSLRFDIKPSNVLLTGNANIRLTTLYKVNYKKDGKTGFTGSNTFLYREEFGETEPGNRWNNHIIPGLEGVHGYNFVNVSHYSIKENRQKLFFEKPVLIRTLYYPSFSKDTLNYKAVNRDYFMVSVYNDDTNKDGFINLKDLRRMYLFNLAGERQKALVPENYSVIKSEYDSDNDFMYVFAQLDANGNGSRDEGEPLHIYWIDLKDPNRTGRQF